MENVPTNAIGAASYLGNPEMLKFFLHKLGNEKQIIEFEN